MGCGVPQKTLGLFLADLKWCEASLQPCIACPLPCPAREKMHAESLRPDVSVLSSIYHRRTAFEIPVKARKAPMKNQ